VTCSDPGANACGSCGPLAGSIGAHCGTCGAYVCSNGAAVCSDPGANVCGTCGSLPAGYGSACGCDNSGSIQCNGACSAGPCPTYTSITFDIATGGDDARSDSVVSATVVINGAGQSFTLKGQNTTWGNNTSASVSVGIGAQPKSAFGTTTIVLVEHPSGLEGDDNWNMNSLRVTLSGPSGSTCLFFGSGNPLRRLTGSAGSAAFAPGGC
jgi:hypothetical protein